MPTHSIGQFLGVDGAGGGGCGEGEEAGVTSGVFTSPGDEVVPAGDTSIAADGVVGAVGVGTVLTRAN